MSYQLPPDVASWSVVFQQLEGNKAKLGIEDYSVSQTTLEQVLKVIMFGKCFCTNVIALLCCPFMQVFLQFAKVQDFGP